MEEADVLGNRIAIVNNGILRCIAPQVRLKSLYGGGYHLQINCHKQHYLVQKRLMQKQNLRKKKLQKRKARSQYSTDESSEEPSSPSLPGTFDMEVIKTQLKEFVN